ncbi:hypothetical protein NX059_009741 [Plenodomus lindquistii]|nr:hypothetical protein NX059_009741 [Plenodomus lindquistii]
MEPYYQLSKENGALGKDSLLLQYPFDFMPFVPFKAARDKHWPVFWASIAVVFVTWGLVPTQAGIFSTKTITRTLNMPFARSNEFIPASEQASRLGVGFAQSTYAIAALNETLSQYMTRNYTLAPTRPSSNTSTRASSHGNWTAPTTMYSVDLYCEPAVASLNPMGRGLVANSTNGCSFTYGLDGNLTMGVNKANNSTVLQNKEFTAMYVGYWNPQGFADYSLDSACPATSNHTFYAAIQRNKVRDSDPTRDVTSIFCWPMYYQQQVSATIDAKTLVPSEVKPSGNKSALETDLFNTTTFEELMSSSSLGSEVRSDVLPIKAIPDYFDYIGRTNVSLSSGATGAASVQPMVGLALAVSERPLEDYLDWQILAKSYADAYRLMFSRAMRDILDQNFSTTAATAGKVQERMEAVVLEPVFVYIVEGLLGAISLAAMALLYLSITRKKHLKSNPSTIASVMAMVADNQALLTDMEGLDCCTMEGIKDHLGHKRYKLVDDGSGPGIVEIDTSATSIDDDTLLPVAAQRRNTTSDIAKPVRPNEFSLWFAFPLVGSFIGLAIGLTAIFIKARAQGLPLPSSNTLVQNIVENYLPTAIATLIEPMWILINRLLCMLQPLEELRGCKARARNSIDADYSSLPPQLVIFKALRTKHFVLAAVCAMALLANLLAVAFSGLFNQITIDMRHSTTLVPPLNLKFVSINGSIGPIGGNSFGSLESSGAYLGGNGEGHFLVADSYLKQGIPLPAWTDETMFYLPMFSESGNNTLPPRLAGRTQSFGAKLECAALNSSDEFQAGLLKEIPTSSTIRPSVNVTIASDNGTKVRCTKTGTYVQRGPIGADGGCVNGTSALELVLVLGPTANATQAEVDVCMGSVVLGWVRDPNGSCGEVKTTMLDEENAVFVHCKPRFTTGYATIQVDADGRLQQNAKDVTVSNVNPEGNTTMFNNDIVNLVGQSNKYIFKTDSPQWHNDSFSGDFINYFAAHMSNSTRLLDPTQGLPSMKDIEGPLTKAYSLLFAIWLGTNKDQLLVAHQERNSPTLQAWRVEPEKRLFLSTPMFAISEGILCTYAIVAIIVYMRRPGQYLARMPTSIAALIALFAASAAVQDMRGTSHLNKKGRARHLKEVDARYGYGDFIGGGDGRVHIGIERTPFVRVRSKTTWLEMKVRSFRKGSEG